MQFTQHASPGLNVIRAYREGSLTVNETTYAGLIIVGPRTLQTASAVRDLDALVSLDMQAVFDLGPELVLLGTGIRQIFPAQAFGAQFLRANIGFEVMDTGAASRTYNVLVAEHREVIALLLA